MTLPTAPRERWDDRRLEAAFALRASTDRKPRELVDETIDRLRSAPRPAPPWQRWLSAAAVIVLAVGVAAGGLALSDQVRGRALFRPGPTADLRTLDTGEFAFDYPASWLAYDASAYSSGGSSTAVLGTLPVERRCGDERHVDINCVYQQRLEPGQVRLHVGTGTYRDGTIQDPPINHIGRITRVEVGGMPALFVESDGSADSFYREDKSLHWEIARPGTGGTSIVELEARLTEPGVSERLTQLEALIASFRFTNGPDPSVPPTPEATPTETAPRLADLRLMTVEELIAAAESPTPEEVIVRGWLTQTNVVRSCPLVLDPGHPLVRSCEQLGLTLTDQQVPTDRGFVTCPPNARCAWVPPAPSIPVIVPLLGVDANASVSTLPGSSIKVLAIGHLLDHRWTTCPPDAHDECKSRFVIDRVVPADQPLDDDLPVPWASPPDRPVGDPSQAIDALSAVVSGVTVVSIGAADADAVRSIEPLVQEINNEEGAWVIRALIGGDTTAVARTFLVGHIGWWTVLEVTETGVVDLLDQPPSEAPTEVLGLPVMSVEEAIAIRDAGRDDREIAVRGWVPPPVPVRCVGPKLPVTSPIEPSCLTMFEVLMEDMEHLAARRPDGLSAQGPAGMAISIDVSDVDQSWRPQLPALGSANPAEIVAIGHFDDRRSGWCDATRIQACRDRFVVDRVEWADGSTQQSSLVANQGTDDSLFAPVEATVAAALPDRPILSAAVLRGTEVDRVEPALREGQAGITDQDAVWIVSVLEDGRAVTYLVPDGTDRIYRVENDGQTVLVGGKPLDAPGRSWPPEGVMDVPMRDNMIGRAPKAGVSSIGPDCLSTPVPWESRIQAGRSGNCSKARWRSSRLLRIRWSRTGTARSATIDSSPPSTATAPANRRTA